MISKMLSQCICCTSETYQILSPVLFQQSLFSPFNSQNVLIILLVVYKIACYRVSDEISTDMNNRTYYNSDWERYRLIYITNK